MLTSHASSSAAADAVTAGFEFSQLPAPVPLPPPVVPAYAPPRYSAPVTTCPGPNRVTLTAYNPPKRTAPVVGSGYAPVIGSGYTVSTGARVRAACGVSWLSIAGPWCACEEE